MLRIACLSVLASLAVGCASRPLPAATATTTRTQTGHATPAASQPASQEVELRHFYLLSPGPSATLVVTRSDTAAGPR